MAFDYDNLKVIKNDEGIEGVYMPSGGGPNDHVFTFVDLEELGYDPREEKD